MTDFGCKWLPQLIPIENYSYWPKYLDELYRIFRNDFILSSPYFNSKVVKIRFEPKSSDGYENAFIHLTHQDTTNDSKDPNDRWPDTKRAERIKWPRKFIENYDCQDNCINCSRIKHWIEEYKGYPRHHFLFEEVRYMVVIEERISYNLLITGFYFDKFHQMDKKLKKYNRYIEQQQKTP